MRRGTTPTVELTLDTSLTGCEYHVTIESGEKQITKRESECQLSEDGKTISLTLTQAETLSLDASKPVRVQVRFKSGSKAYATNIARTTVEDILLEGAI